MELPQGLGALDGHGRREISLRLSFCVEDCGRTNYLESPQSRLSCMHKGGIDGIQSIQG